MQYKLDRASYYYSLETFVGLSDVVVLTPGIFLYFFISFSFSLANNLLFLLPISSSCQVHPYQKRLRDLEENKNRNTSARLNSTSIFLSNLAQHLFHCQKKLINSDVRGRIIGIFPHKNILIQSGRSTVAKSHFFGFKITYSQWCSPKRKRGLVILPLNYVIRLWGGGG